MIAIINRGETHSKTAPDERIYEVKINTKTIVFFTHRRNEGLSVCLKKASNAVKKMEE